MDYFSKTATMIITQPKKLESQYKRLFKLPRSQCRQEYCFQVALCYNRLPPVSCGCAAEYPRSRSRARSLYWTRCPFLGVCRTLTTGTFLFILYNNQNACGTFPQSVPVSSPCRGEWHSPASILDSGAYEKDCVFMTLGLNPVFSWTANFNHDFHFVFLA